MALSLITGVAFGLAPALKATRVDVLPALRDEGVPPIDHRRLTLKNALIVVQVAVSVLLLGATSIFLQQLAATSGRRVGHAVDGVAMLETDARFAGYPPAAVVNVYDELLRRIAAVPGVQSAALLYGPPMQSATVATVAEGAARDAVHGLGRAGLLRDAAHPAAARACLRRPRSRGHPERRGGRRDDGAAALRRGRRRRAPLPAREPAELLDGGHRRRPRHRRASLSPDDVPLDSRPSSPLVPQSGLVPTTVVARTSGDAAALSGRCSASCAPWTPRCR